MGCAGLVLAFLGYQLYVTDFLNDRVQAEAMAALDDEREARRSQLPAPAPVEVTVPEEVEQEAEEREPPAFVRAAFVPESAVPQGAPLGRLTIEAIGVGEVVFEGVDREALK